MLRPKGSWNTQIIPDSEEETSNPRETKVAFREVVEISSSDSSDEDVTPEHVKGKAAGTWDYRCPSQKKADAVAPAPKTPSRISRKAYGASYMRSRIIESSDSETEERSSGPSTLSVEFSNLTQTAEDKEQPRARCAPNFWFLKKQTSSMMVEVNSDSENDAAILVFDEPKSARKPKRLIPSHSSIREENPTQSEPRLVPAELTQSESEPLAAPLVPGPASPKKKQLGTSRMTAKKKRDDQKAKLYAYAASFFDEVNRTVFKHGLPKDTKLNWNKRLLTTAGRAKWHRSRDGVQSSEIELAEKILTSYERIRNTLSHEMCHLASWVIDKEIKEGHGKFWKAWTLRVMAKYPDIDISTRHDYEIEYPYKWKCAKCDKIYGRFSKSIKPDECVCGACREGRLIPQFKTYSRTPITPKMSRMAAVTTQGSPYTPTRSGPASASAVGEIILVSSDSEGDSGEQGYYRGRVSICEIASDTDGDEIEVLTMTLTTTSIADS